MHVDALGEILTIKIIETLREKEGGIYGGGARGSMSKMPYASFSFGISFPCGPDNVDKLVAATMDEIALIKKNGPTEKDLNKVKEAYLLEHKENLQSNRYWLQTISKIDQEKRNVAEVTAFEAAVNSMTIDDVKRAANTYLNEDYVLAVLKPEAK
jgi:zinc protease